MTQNELLMYIGALPVLENDNRAYRGCGCQYALYARIGNALGVHIFIFCRNWLKLLSSLIKFFQLAVDKTCICKLLTLMGDTED